MISPFAMIFPNVRLGENCIVEDFAIIGHPPRGAKPGEMRTEIGGNAVIRSHSVIYAGNIIGDDLETGHGAMVREENTIGNKVSIGTGSVIEHHITIGDDVRIHSNCFVPEYTLIEDGCRLAPNAILTAAKHPLSLDVKKNIQGPILRKNCYIGANATILARVEIGENAMIGAGAVVTKDIPANMVVIGNPAKTLRNITKKEEKE